MKNEYYSTVALYLRVSTREQAINGYSIHAQENKLKRYLKDQKIKYDDLIIFADEGFSAGSTNRPDFLRMEEAIKNDQIDLVLATKLDRISREPVDLELFFRVCQLHHTDVAAITGEIKIDTANGRFVTGILSLISKWERETTKERTFDTLVEICEDGLFPYGYTPYGYKKTNKKLFIDETTSQIVKEIFSCAESGNPLELISKKIKILYDTRIRSDRIGTILSKEYYYGKFVYGGKSYYNIFPAIISKDTFCNAQAVRKKRYHAIQNKNFYFCNQLRCTCGSILYRRLTKKKNKRYYYYYCPECKKRINQDRVIEELLPDLLRHADHKSLSKELKYYRRKHKYLSDRIERLYEDYIGGQIDGQVYAFTLSKLSADRDSILKKINLKCSIGFSDFYVMTNEARYELMETYVSHVVIDLKLMVIVKIAMK